MLAQWFRLSPGIQGWEERPGEELLHKMEVLLSKNKGRRSGVMRALERSKIVVIWKDIRQLFQLMPVSRVGVVAEKKRSSI